MQVGRLRGSPRSALPTEEGGGVHAEGRGRRDGGGSSERGRRAQAQWAGTMGACRCTGRGRAHAWASCAGAEGEEAADFPAAVLRRSNCLPCAHLVYHVGAVD